jgi:hypothetical protein
VSVFRLRRRCVGSWFVLERWIAENPFRNARSPAQSDLDVVHGSTPKDVLQHHWDSWMTEADWKWIAERGINTVRIPVRVFNLTEKRPTTVSCPQIGYYHLCAMSPSIIKGTEFAPFGDIFEGAWRKITNAIETAHAFGIGVLLGACLCSSDNFLLYHLYYTRFACGSRGSKLGISFGHINAFHVFQAKAKHVPYN